MANSFGSLYVGASGLQGASHGLNTTANNLTNVNTEGYVREQVVYEDRNYRQIGWASISNQFAGLGVDVGTIVHKRDIFLDKAYRTENGRYSFYSASAEAVDEVQTFLQEQEGVAFKDAIKDFYEAFAEFAKDPSDTVNQNLVLQKASLFLSRSGAIQDGLEDYQTIINSKIIEDVDRINEIGEQILDYNKRIQAIEAAGVEKAMELRDKRDLLIDELSGLAKITYREDAFSVVHIEIEGTEFVDEIHCNAIGKYKDLTTGFITPYWVNLTTDEDLAKDPPEPYQVFDLSRISAETNTDLGEIKSLLLARGDSWTNYLNFLDDDGVQLDADTYNSGIANSIMMNAESELDTLIHQLVTNINDMFSPLTTLKSAYEGATSISYTDINGGTVTTDGNVRILDVANASVGTDGELPPRELFVRNGCERYYLATCTVTYEDGTTEERSLYLYNEEDPDDTSKCYTLKSLTINTDLEKQEAYLPHLLYSAQDTVNYELGTQLEALWSATGFNLNPADTTPSTYTEFYTKWIGEVGTIGNIYSSTASSLQTTSEQIEFSRQGVIGVSSDEELTTMIKYQSAYNAASRYINVIDEMIEHLITSL